MLAHDAAALLIAVAAIVSGALGSPPLTALVCAAVVWVSFYGAITGMKIVRHPAWRFHGDAALRWTLVFLAFCAGLIGGGLDAIAAR